MERGDVLRLTRRLIDRTEVWLSSLRGGDGSGTAGMYVPKVHRHVYPRAYEIDRLPCPIQASAVHTQLRAVSRIGGWKGRAAYAAYSCCPQTDGAREHVRKTMCETGKHGLMQRSCPRTDAPQPAS